MELSRQEYWSGLPFPTSEVLPDQRIEPASPALAGGFFFFFKTTEPPWKPRCDLTGYEKEFGLMCKVGEEWIGIWLISNL